MSRTFMQRLLGEGDTPPEMKVVAPEWQSKELVLPPWAKVKEDSVHVAVEKVALCVEVDTRAATKYWLDLLGNPALDQYWLEVVYQCTKLDVQSALVGTVYDLATSKLPVEIHMTKAPELALTKHPAGKGIKAASKGLEAREHYRRIRGRLPY